jgi:hypothetical protein
MTGLLFRPWLFGISACLWWLGVFAYDFLRFTPNPSISVPWIDWHQMDAVQRMGPWMIAPFAALCVWSLLACVPRPAARACFAGAASWAAFVFWRAHEQAVTCAVWIPPEDLRSACAMPGLLGSAVLWLVLPVIAGLVAAVSAQRSSARAEQIKSLP